MHSKKGNEKKRINCKFYSRNSNIKDIYNISVFAITTFHSYNVCSSKLICNIFEVFMKHIFETVSYQFSAIYFDYIICKNKKVK